MGCSDTVKGLGPDAQVTIGLADLRFYVSNLRFEDATGAAVPVTLDQNDFHYESAAGAVSMIDLTSNEEGSCAGNAIAFAEGTARTNTAITGTTLVDSVRAISFDVGVPQGLMRSIIAENSVEGAPSPLNEMMWTWATGYRHFVMNFSVQREGDSAGEGYLHVGSRDCGPADGLALEDRAECDFVNTPRVRLEGFDLAANKVSLDLRKLVQGIDFVSPIYNLETFEVIGEGPGAECHSSPMQPDCANLFENLGMNPESGSAKASDNAVFGVE